MTLQIAARRTGRSDLAALAAFHVIPAEAALGWSTAVAFRLIKWRNPPREWRNMAGIAVPEAQECATRGLGGGGP